MREFLRSWGARFLVAALAVPVRATATPMDLILVNDPLEEELRALHVAGEDSLPHPSTRPARLPELPDFGRASSHPVVRFARHRLQRSLARDRPEVRAERGTTRRWIERFQENQSFTLSAGLEGSARFERGRDPRLDTGTGGHVRAGLHSGPWFAQVHGFAGHVPGAVRYAGRLLPRTDAVVLAEEAFVGYSSAPARWSLVAGHGRWHWGPGREGSLLLSRTAPALTGMTFAVHLPFLRADGFVLSATLDHPAGEQLAAHRLEWEPRKGLRVGVAEAARYRSGGWNPLYVLGILPYTVVDNLLGQSAADSVALPRNNVLAAMDVSWRLVPGQRVYGELLIDDLRTDDAPIVHKLGWQLGWEGVGPWGGRGLRWNAECTRLMRYIYTSYYGRALAAQDRPLGYPTGPDSRRLRAETVLDLSSDWQIRATAVRTDQGESDLAVAFVPGVTTDRSTGFAGIVETSRLLRGAVRWWPASGVDLEAALGWSWVENQGHIAGQDRDRPFAEVAVRLTR